MKNLSINIRSFNRPLSPNRRKGHTRLSIWMLGKNNFARDGACTRTL